MTFENNYNNSSCEDESIQLLITKNVVTIDSCQNISYLIICHSYYCNLHYLHLGSDRHLLPAFNLISKISWMEGEVEG